jgi:hypothetical protein
MRQQYMISSIVGLGPNCELARPSIGSMRRLQTCQRGCPILKNHKYLKIISVERKINWLPVPDVGLIPGQTDRLTISPKITIT